MSQTIIAVAVVLAMALMVTASPVYPTNGLEQMRPEDACLFFCNICFEGQVKEMLRCANDVCPRVAMGNFNLNLLWMTNECKEFQRLHRFGRDTSKA